MVKYISLICMLVLCSAAAYAEENRTVPEIASANSPALKGSAHSAGQTALMKDKESQTEAQPQLRESPQLVQESNVLSNMQAGATSAPPKSRGFAGGGGGEHRAND